MHAPGAPFLGLPSVLLLLLLLQLLLLLGGDGGCDALYQAHDKRSFFTNSGELAFPRLGRRSFSLGLAHASAQSPLPAAGAKRSFYTSSQEVGLPRIGRSGAGAAPLQGQGRQEGEGFSPSSSPAETWPHMASSAREGVSLGSILRMPTVLDFLALDKDGDGHLAPEEFLGSVRGWVPSKQRDV